MAADDLTALEFMLAHRSRFTAERIREGRGPIGFVGMWAIRDHRASGPNPWTQGHLFWGPNAERDAMRTARQLNLAQAAIDGLERHNRRGLKHADISVRAHRSDKSYYWSRQQ